MTGGCKRLDHMGFSSRLAVLRADGLRIGPPRHENKGDETVGRNGLFCAVLVTALALGTGAAQAQTFTMGKECRSKVEAAQQLNDAGDYTSALAAFDAVHGDCDTKDAREAIQGGRAHALNGLGRHAEAIDAANRALKVSDDQSLVGYFERAIAQEKLGNMEAATADYDRIIKLTEKNQNVKERATIYAKVADMNARAGKKAEAESYYAKAVELDPGNPDFDVLRGDWAVLSGDYDTAFRSYDAAMAKGKTGADMYKIRSEARIKQMQDKYGTTNVQELRARMSPQETAQVCAELGKAAELGMKDMQLDMFSALVCK
jgi:tetratricopeptide (TPR) repeat protein